jgi:hypothetical protein
MYIHAYNAGVGVVDSEVVSRIGSWDRFYNSAKNCFDEFYPENFGQIFIKKVTDLNLSDYYGQ